MAHAPIILLCAACASGGGYDATNTLGVLPPQRPTPLWLGAIHGNGPTPAGNMLAGAAAVTPAATPGWTHILISLNNVPVGGTYSWSLRSGSCGSQGGILGPTDRYADFSIRADGSGSAEAVVPVVLSPSSPYAVVASPIARNSDVSGCADLSRESM